MANQRLKNLTDHKKIIVLIFILALFLRLFFLFTEPQDMWHDASFTYLFSKEPVSFILDSNDVHPSLYYILMKGFLLISDNEQFLRCTSILFFSCFFWALYFFLRRNLDWKTGIITLFMVSVSITMIHYSLEIRNYMLGMFFVVMQLYYFFEYIYWKRPKQAWLFILFSILMLYTHYYTMFVLGVEAIYIIWKLKDRIMDFTTIGMWITFFSVPLVIHLIRTLPKMQSMWFNDITLLSFFSTFTYQLMLPETITSWHLVFFIFFTGLVFYYFYKTKPEPFYYMFFLIPVGMLWLISQLSPLYHHRFFLFYAPALYIIIASTISYYWERNKHLGLVLYLIFGLLFAYSSGMYDKAITTELHDSQLVLKNYLDPNLEYTFIHRSPFSFTPYSYYFRDWNVHNMLDTNLNKIERFTAGGSVIKDYQIIINKNLINCYDGCYYIHENWLPIPEDSTFIFNEGGLVVHG